MSERSVPESGGKIKRIAPPPTGPEAGTKFDHDIVVLYVRVGFRCKTYRRWEIVRLLRKVGFHILPQDDGDNDDQVVTRPILVQRLKWKTYEEATKAIAEAAGGAVECDWQCYDDAGSMEFAYDPTQA